MGKDDQDVGVYACDGPTGWKLDTPEPREAVFNVGGLTPADERRLQVARQHFTEASANDFDHQGKELINRHTIGPSCWNARLIG